MVKIYHYSIKFIQVFRKERRKLKKILGNKVSIEHFGSTAVSGLTGKGVIDIMIGFDNRKDLQQAIPLLQANGYTLDRTVRKSRVFLSTSGEKESDLGDIHLHLALKNSLAFKEALIFRDYLRKNKQLQKRYSQLKEQLIKRVKNNRKLYTKLKSNFIKRVLNSTDLWKEH